MRRTAFALLLAGTLSTPAVHAAPLADADVARAQVAAARLAQRLDAELARLRGESSAPASRLDAADAPGSEWREDVSAAASRPLRSVVTFDSTFHVRPGVTLAVRNPAGSVTVRAWDRNEVRVLARRDRDDRIHILLSGDIMRLGVSAGAPLPAPVQWELTVPEWLAVSLEGLESDLAVRGLRAPLQARTVRGDVLVEDCQGPLQVNSVEGEVLLEDVAGSVVAASANSVIRMVRVRGAIEAQSVNGDIHLEQVMAPSVDVSSLNGRVFYASPYQPRGRYAFGSHNGGVFVPTPVDQGVRVVVQTYSGQVEVPVATPLPRAMGRPVPFVLGAREAGPAAPELELESFGGAIRVVSMAELLREMERQRALVERLRAAARGR